MVFPLQEEECANHAHERHEKYQYAPKSLRVRLIHLPMVLRCICFVLIVCAMARPQTHTAWDNKTVEGIDIMLAMDVSTSMLAEDLRPNRMEAAKDVATEFISGRPNDNIGLTILPVKLSPSAR